MVDERVEHEKPRECDIRRTMLGLYEVGKIGYRFMMVKQTIDHWGAIIWYIDQHPTTKPRKPMDVDRMVAQWREALVGITLAHDRKQVDEWEFRLNELLEPFLKAPVKQIREFYKQLLAALKDDPSVPFFIWVGLEAWGKTILEKATDQGLLELKGEVAMRIARAVEGDVQPQLAEAIANALKWRDPESLEKIEKAVRKGHRAKLTGKESCLFLEVGGETIML